MTNKEVRDDTTVYSNHFNPKGGVILANANYRDLWPSLILWQCYGLAGRSRGNQNSARAPHNPSSIYIQSRQLLGPPVGAVTTSIHNNHPIGPVSMIRVTIDLTDESQPPLSAASRDTSVHQTPQSSVQSKHSPLNALPSQHPTANYGAADCVPSQYPSDPSAQNQRHPTSTLRSIIRNCVIKEPTRVALWQAARLSTSMTDSSRFWAMQMARATLRCSPTTRTRLDTGL